MKVYVSMDAEGVSGIFNLGQVMTANREYEFARRMMANDINAAAEGETVYVALVSAKPGLYYGIAAANDLSLLNEEATSTPLVRAGTDGVIVPVTKPIGGRAFFKVVVSDRAR